MKKLIVVMVTLFQLIDLAKAQTDPHFSQYYAYPLWLNPALTGVMDGDLRINGNFKDQWSTINDAYRTDALSVDFRPAERLGLGFNMINQISGGAGYHYFAAYGSFAYEIPVNHPGDQRINFGIQAGIVNRSFDISKLQFGSQYDPLTGYNPNLPSNESFLNSNSTIFDVGAGLFYHDDDPLKTARVFAGVSIAHITQSDDPIKLGDVNNRLPVRYILHGGLRIKMSDYFDIIPHGIYIGQQESAITALGVSSELKKGNGNYFILGGMYRVNDAAIINIGYNVNNLGIGLSYDFNISDLSTATNGRGGIELSLSYIIHKSRYNRKPICPSF